LRVIIKYSFVTQSKFKIMKPHFLNLVNALVLIILGGWAYMEKGSPTALIPVFMGAILWILTPKMRQGDKNASHTAAILTLLIVIGLFMPLRRELRLDDTMGVLRSITMLGSSLLAFSVFVKSFMDARKTA
jgi:Transmembrane proteins 14C